MSLTRLQSAAALARNKVEVIGADNPNHPIELAFAHHHITDIVDLLQLSSDDVDEMEYIPTGETDPQPLQLGHRTKLKLFILWCATLREANGGNHLSEAQWNTTSSADFDDFRMLGIAQITGTPTRNAAPAAAPAPRAAASNTAEFKKGNKRDPAAYTVLKDIVGWNAWNDSTIALARAHDVIDVFDPTFVPDQNDPDEVSLFEHKKSFVYSVLLRCLQFDKGKEFVREHKGDFDAQAVYHKLLEYASTSTDAELAKTKLIYFLTTAKLDSSWRGSTKSFVFHWRTQFSLLDELLPVDQQYPEGVKKRMLENAVDGISDLRVVKDNDNIRVASGRPPPLL